MGYRRQTVDIRVGKGLKEGVQYRLKAQPPPGDRRVRFTYCLATGATHTQVIDAVPFPSLSNKRR